MLEIRVPKWLVLHVLLTALLAVTAGCGGGGGGQPSANSFSFRAEVFDIPLDGSVIVSAISPTKYSLTGSLPPIGVGSVLVNRTGEGFARRVTDVTPVASGIEVETVQATLPEIFLSAELKEKRSLGADSFSSIQPLIPGVTVTGGRSDGRAGRASSEFTINFVNAKFYPNPNDQTKYIVLNGSGTLRLSDEIELNVDLNGLKYLKVVPTISVNVNVRISGRVEADDVTIPYIQFVGAPLAFGPIIIVPTFKVAARIDGHAEFGVNFVDVTLAQQVATGMEYGRDFGWRSIKSVGQNTKSNPSPNLYFELGLSFTPASPEFALKLYGVVGPSLNLDCPKLEASLAFQTSPPGRRFRLGATFAASGRFRADILGQGIGVDFPDLLSASYNVVDIFWPDNGGASTTIR